MDTNSTPTAPASLADNRFIKGFNAVLPVIQWVLTVSLVIGGYILYYRDSNISQAATLREVQTEQKRLTEVVNANKTDGSQQIQDLRREMLPREIFEARMDGIEREIEQNRKILEKILDKQK